MAIQWAGESNYLAARHTACGLTAPGPLCCDGAPLKLYECAWLRLTTVFVVAKRSEADGATSRMYDGDSKPGRFYPMTWFADLDYRCYFTVKSGKHLRSVGWLDADHPFTRGDVSSDFLLRLEEFVRQWHDSDISFSDMGTCGAHTCELCKETYSFGEVCVPAGPLLYVAPAMILHYIVDHHYRPPDQFIAAVMSSPLPLEPEFAAAAERFRVRHRGMEPGRIDERGWPELLRDWFGIRRSNPRR